MNRSQLKLMDRNAWRLTAYKLERCRAGAEELERIIAGAKLGARLSAGFVASLAGSQPTPALVKWRPLSGR